MPDSARVARPEPKNSPYRARDDDRPLADFLPLGTPFGILIDPCNACNFACTFCPTGDSDLLKSVGRTKGIMRLSLFEKIIDDISVFPDKIKRLHLYKDGEPFINKQLERMIGFAVEKDVAESVETTTNGALINGDRAAKIVESGLHKIRISVEHVDDAGYERITQRPISYDDIRRNVERLYAEKERRNSPLHIHAKIVDAGLSDEDKAKFLRDFGPISDSTNIDGLMGWDGQRDWTLGQDLQTGMDGQTPLRAERTVCPEPFKSMSINFDGRVSVCCVDWSMGTVVGDTSTESVVDIWNGPRMRAFRLTHLRGRRATIPACARCQYVHGIRQSSDLDQVADDLLRIYA